MRAALAEGVIDVVATDHAPHAAQYKDTEWAAARPGMLGLQTALSVLVHAMVEPGPAGLARGGRVLSERPAQIAGLPDQGRPIAVGEPATLALVDPDGVWTVRGAALASRAANTPLRGHAAAGDGGRHRAARPGHRPGRDGAPCLTDGRDRAAGPGGRPDLPRRGLRRDRARASARPCSPPA